MTKQTLTRESLEAMTVADLVKLSNGLPRNARVANRQIVQWKASKAKLVDRILKAVAKNDRPVDLIDVAMSKGISPADFAKLAEGKSRDEVSAALDDLPEMFDHAHDPDRATNEPAEIIAPVTAAELPTDKAVDDYFAAQQEAERAESFADPDETPVTHLPPVPQEAIDRAFAKADAEDAEHEAMIASADAVIADAQAAVAHSEELLAKTRQTPGMRRLTARASAAKLAEANLAEQQAALDRASKERSVLDAAGDLATALIMSPPAKAKPAKAEKPAPAPKPAKPAKPPKADKEAAPEKPAPGGPKPLPKDGTLNRKMVDLLCRPEGVTTAEVRALGLKASVKSYAAFFGPHCGFVVLNEPDGDDVRWRLVNP
jgi:hypothetical protein